MTRYARNLEGTWPPCPLPGYAYVLVYRLLNISNYCDFSDAGYSILCLYITLHVFPFAEIKQIHGVKTQF